ncbi:MAG: hypothetical protein KF901_11365 [Myxococcales bacterium]|nr:hypothetical protein [Myxococcales bacterium]
MRSLRVTWLLLAGLACDPQSSTPAAPTECSTQPCCGEPPRPCGEVIEEAVGAACVTACDCRFPGLACREGRCRSGAEAIYCCTACPERAAGSRCQRVGGSFGVCGPS